MDRKKVTRKGKNNKDNAQKKSRGIVVVPYVHSFEFREKIQRIFAKHREATAVKPHIILRRVLVQPKDQIGKQNNRGGRGVQNSMQPLCRGVHRGNWQTVRSQDGRT